MFSKYLESLLSKNELFKNICAVHFLHAKFDQLHISIKLQKLYLISLFYFYAASSKNPSQYLLSFYISFKDCEPTCRLKNTVEHLDVLITVI